MDYLDEFEACTTDTVKNGRRAISCKLGLWSVESTEGDMGIFSEAMHYFNHYKDDGEYHQIIGGKSPAEVMMNKGVM